MLTAYGGAVEPPAGYPQLRRQGGPAGSQLVQRLLRGVPGDACGSLHSSPDTTAHPATRRGAIVARAACPTFTAIGSAAVHKGVHHGFLG
jgi:hypothetical protein